MSISLPPHLPAAPHRRPPLVVATLAFGVAAAYLLWLRFSGSSPEARSGVVAALFIALDLAIVALFQRAASNPTFSAGTARALRYLAAAAAVALVGRAIALFELANGRAPGVSVANLFLLAIYPLTLAAFLSLPRVQRPTERLRLVFDAGMVLCGGGVALWYFVLRDTAASGVAPVAGIALALVYPLADLLLLVAIVTVLLRHPAD